jgi:F-type H+-transporting ATPase subunit delta
MSGEATTIARPYAEATFARALETDSLDKWAEMLDLLVQLVTNPEIAGLLSSHRLDQEQMSSLMLDVAGDELIDEGQNLVRLLVDNGRLAVAPEINVLFTEMKNAHQGALEVMVSSAYVLKPAQEKHLAEALSKKLGREIHITSEKNPDLLGGVKIRAGDMVIDGTVAGQLKQLANELGI